MGEFHVLYIRRSDGKLEVRSKKSSERNEPPASQLNSTPDKDGAADFYRPLAYDEVKHLDWRRKLGGMLVRELQGDAWRAEKGYILHDFPENYRLFEHIKIKAKKDGEDGAKNTKTHAGGGHDRQDAYLYGHPQGRKKRFRSPADFFPHLLWLATDETGNTDNCSCKLCVPEELQKPAEDAKAQDGAKGLKPQLVVKKEDMESTVEIVVRKPSAPITHNPSQMKAPVSASATPSIPTPSVPPSMPLSTLPLPRNQDQELDLKYNAFMFRQGELLWFDRSSAWGLGVLVRRYNVPDQNTNIRAYVVQPLSYPADHHERTFQVTVFSESSLRPWLAWSAPPLTTAALNSIQGLTYNSADWPGIIAGKFGPGDSSVDGSILAARAIDSSYTLFEQLPFQQANREPGVEDRSWNGIFFGGEKVWIGDPLRIKSQDLNNLFVLSQIIERANTPGVYLIGNLYTCSIVAKGHQPPSDRNILPRMREDMRVRNSIANGAGRPSTFWNLVQANCKIDLGSIVGRWYEFSLIMPILDGADNWNMRVQSGDVKEAGISLNPRGHYSNQPFTRYPSRLSAFGNAVPQGTQLVEGIEPPPLPEETQVNDYPDVSASHDALMHDASLAVGVDDFLNLDGADQDALPGYVHGYGGQGGNGHGFF
ncbi:hypothetical protein K402DRAFT_445106 [Aulographum hederae CBS 113979]|uniref:Cryptic loci regulator 2 N-terminal domain-containing protein n=1 Tax=Aulographum hederae CBS 113979 TaxID=1176131 RepID=A0A6G1H7X7_9PEZI|nr:hypothetical protein K402DRAFT_445106 [Aulographum hederae CBS 113979]